MNLTEKALERAQEIAAAAVTEPEYDGHLVTLVCEGALDQEWLIPSDFSRLPPYKLQAFAERLAREVTKECDDTEVFVSHVYVGTDYIEGTGYHFTPCGRYTAND